MKSSLISGIHHVEIFTKSLRTALALFVEKFGFSPLAVHRLGPTYGTVVSNGNVHFLLRQELTDHRWQPFRDGLPIDFVSDVAFESLDLKNLLQHMSHDSILSVTPQPIQDAKNCSVSKIRSCIPFLHHSLIEKKTSEFALPDYESLSDSAELLSAFNISPAVSLGHQPDFTGAFIDHIAVACNPGGSQLIMDWYSSFFKFQRFLVNKTEGDDGFLVRYKNSGMNLKAMTSCNAHNNPSVKLVFAESLNAGRNQINSFLEEHGSTGVQHIAINLGENFVDAVQSLRARGVEFMDPPPSYYDQVGKLHESYSLNLDAEKLRCNKILVDTEAMEECDKKSYLLQVFTKPIFAEETFFLEFISRRGALGFGAGNISALWRAVELYMSGTSNKEDGVKSVKASA